MTGPVAVIIPARNAQTTIGDAVTSALDQPEVSEVVVVDDASSDATGHIARTAAANDKRLTVLRHEVNVGPAAARNLAIARSTAPFIAILDADDYLLPGRFGTLLALPAWDMVADNIVFVAAEKPERLDGGSLPKDRGGSELLDLAAFVRGNIAQKNVRRGELGFLKPVIRRSALPQDGPVYDPALRLGEDYDLYVRLLLAGARFRLSRRVGYVARVRADSLSGQHRTGDLEALLQATKRHAAGVVPNADAAAAIRDHQRQLQARYLLRAFLDRKAGYGAGAALAFALTPPSNLFPIIQGLLTDKLRTLRRPAPPAFAPFRTLLPIHDPVGYEMAASTATNAPDVVSSTGNSPAAQAPASSSVTQERR